MAPAFRRRREPSALDPSYLFRRAGRKLGLRAARIAFALRPGRYPEEGLDGRRLIGGPAAAGALVGKIGSRLVPYAVRPVLLARLAELAPAAAERALHEAEMVMDHRIPVLGTSFALGPRIDWSRDPRSGRRWPPHFHADLPIMGQGDGSDVKYVWELNRFHHALALGKGYWISGEERFPAEFSAQVESWMEANPPDAGVNWNCAMEAAIRAINLSWAFAFLQSSPALSPAFRARFLGLIHAHGRHLWRNLENRGPVPANHYLADLLGLFHIGTVFPVFRSSARWADLGRRRLVEELSRQVLPDGTSFEASIPYHRLVTEMALHAALLASAFSPRPGATRPEACRASMGEAFTRRLEGMVEFIHSYSRPEGGAPQIGDNDGGRILPLGGIQGDMGDHRFMLATAGEFFDRDDFRSAASGWEEAVWVLGGDVRGPGRPAALPGSSAFRDGGFFVMRHGRDHMVLRCAGLGTGGRGTHTHNDALSFELCAGGVPFVVDPGTGSYTGDPATRDLLRSTAAHNTLMADGREQNGIDPGDLFHLREGSVAEVLSWQSTPEMDLFRGRVSPLPRGRKDAVIEREVGFSKRERKWVLIDTVQGAGEASLSWRFHLAPGVAVEPVPGGFVMRAPAKGSDALLLSIPPGVEGKVIPGVHSPSYGSVAAAEVLHLATRAALPGRFTLSFSAMPGGAGGCA